MTARSIPTSALVGAVAGAAVTSAAVGWVGAAVYLAKKVVTPGRRRPDDTRILALGPDTITVSRTPETVVPGRYGLFADAGAAHLRFGEVVHDDPVGGAVTRVLDGVDHGHPHVGPARFHSYYYATNPQAALGLPYRSVALRSVVGDLPTWVVPGGDGSRWAVLVHGRGAGREETLRAMPTLHAAGWTSLVPSYRNDPDAPASTDGRYALGLSEWRDVDAAVAWALEQGAREVALVGWSMGGAIVLQTLANSARAQSISRVVLDGPVVDWGDVLFHHAATMGVPLPLTAMSLRLLASAPTRGIVGVEESIDIAHTNFVARAAELSTPTLIIHSVDDEFVPVGPSMALAQSRPDLVRLETWSTARHCKEWNVDPARWERVVGDFLA